MKNALSPIKEHQNILQQNKTKQKRHNNKSMANPQVCVLGEGGVGKTALTIQLCSGRFVTEYDPTIEDSYRKQLMVNDRAVMVEILDTAGQEEFKAQRDEWIRDCNGFVIVYSITSRSSFDCVQGFHSSIQRVKEDERFSVALAGNKADLENKREVTSEEGSEMATRLGAHFRETSAKTKMNIEDVFIEVVKSILESHPESAPAETSTKKERRGLCVML
mmetsp:Transcript_13144/g.20240  ORF Transcript_13144/g.20240 Transcript_13144/m.20240 type:complete len:219 (-) Transcript_13144:77-733(-)